MSASSDRFVIVGGGPTALAAARAYRDSGGDGEILMISADTEAPYHRPPLSKEFLRGEAEDADLPMEGWGFYRDYRVNLVLDDPVISLDPVARSVNTASGRTASYRTCLLATGAEPARPSLPGVHHPRVLTLRSAASGRELRRAAGAARSAVVVGAGFIGCEASVSLSRLGVQVTVVFPDELPQRGRLGAEAGRKLLHWLKTEGVSVLAGTRFTGVDDGYRVHTDLVPSMDTDLVLLATGVRPRIELAGRAGLTVSNGRVCADEHMRTSAAGVLAAGDVAFAYNVAAERPLVVEHWGEALTMGEIAGRTAAGQRTRWANAPGFWSVLGSRKLKYTGWGDGYDSARLVSHREDSFTVWYGRAGVTVGVLTHDADEDHERGRSFVEQGKPLDAVST